MERTILLESTCLFWTVKGAFVIVRWFIETKLMRQKVKAVLNYG